MNLISGLLISDPSKRFTWDDFFNHTFIVEPDSDDEDSKNEESEFGELDSQQYSIIKKNSLEKVKEFEDDIATTENGDEFEIITKNRSSDVTGYDNSKLSSSKGPGEDKQSNSDEGSEKLALKSSGTEYNFYNSDESKGGFSMFSSNSSSMQPFKKIGEVAITKNSLKVVREVSNGAIEEDPDEDIKTSKENSTTDKFNEVSEDLNKHEPETDQNGLAELSFTNDSYKIKEFMKDLIRRSNMIMSFYDEIYLDGVNNISKTFFINLL